MDWFSEGYEKVEQRSREIDDAMNRTYLPDLIIKESDDDVVVRFITKEPITFYEHFLPNLKRSFTCPDGGDSSKGNCPLCASGNKATFRGAYMVLDQRTESWKDKNGNTQTRVNTPKIAKFGVRVLKSLAKVEERIIKKGHANGLLDFDFEVMRTGSGTDTSYTFTPTGKTDVSVPQLAGEPKKLLIDAIKPKSKDELLRIIGGSNTPQPTIKRNPINFDSDDDDVINFS